MYTVNEESVAVEESSSNTLMIMHRVTLLKLSKLVLVLQTIYSADDNFLCHTIL